MFFYDSIPLNISGYNTTSFQNKEPSRYKYIYHHCITFLPHLYRIKLGRGKKQKQIKQNNK